MSKNIIETVVGVVVIAIAVLFVWIAYQSGSLERRGVNTYSVYAKFDRADGLKLGSDVRISGILVGKVANMSIENNSYLALVELSIDKKLQLPVDTHAEIVGSLFGDKYIALVPGASEELIGPGATITYTQSSVNIEGLLGKFMFGAARNGQSSDENPAK